MRYDVFLIEKEIETGLNKAEIMDAMDTMYVDDVFPLEIGGENSIAMGFITTIAADSLDYDLRELKAFVASILADMERENELGEYQFESENGKTISIFLSR